MSSYTNISYIISPQNSTLYHLYHHIVSHLITLNHQYHHIVSHLITQNHPYHRIGSHLITLNHLYHHIVSHLITQNYLYHKIVPPLITLNHPYHHIVSHLITQNHPYHRIRSHLITQNQLYRHISKIFTENEDTIIRWLAGVIYHWHVDLGCHKYSGLQPNTRGFWPQERYEIIIWWSKISIDIINRSNAKPSPSSMSSRKYVYGTMISRTMRPSRPMISRALWPVWHIIIRALWIPQPMVTCVTCVASSIHDLSWVVLCGCLW